MATSHEPPPRVKRAQLPVRGGQWLEFPLLAAIRDGDIPMVRTHIRAGCGVNDCYASLAPEVGGWHMSYCQLSRFLRTLALGRCSPPVYRPCLSHGCIVLHYHALHCMDGPWL